jgi:hypothetical protein
MLIGFGVLKYVDLSPLRYSFTAIEEALHSKYQLPKSIIYNCPLAKSSRQRSSKSSIMADLDDAIAVIGLDLRFPGDGTDAESFFDMLLKGRSAMTEVPSDRYKVESFYHPDPERAGTVS